MVLYWCMLLAADTISMYLFSLYKCKNVFFLCTAEGKCKGPFPSIFPDWCPDCPWKCLCDNAYGWKAAQFVVLSLLLQWASHLDIPRCSEYNTDRFSQRYKTMLLLSKTFVPLWTQYHSLQTVASKGCCWCKVIFINFPSSLQICPPLSWACSLREMKTSTIWHSASASMALSGWMARGQAGSSMLWAKDTSMQDTAAGYHTW